MDLRRLRYFVAVAQTRHFGRAAERLFVAQPALSQQIKALETELAVVLFTRSTRRVELTPAGVRLLERAQEILHLADSAVVEVRRVHAGEEGLIRLGFIGSATYELMPALSRSLQADLPMLQVELKGELLSPEVAVALVERRIDIGVLRPFDAPDGVQVRTLRSEPLVVAVPAGHPGAGAGDVALAALAAEPFVGYVRAGSAMANVVATACAAAGFEPQIRAEVRETAALVSFVAAGIGVALVPASVQSVRIPGVVFLPLSDLHPTVDLVVAWRTDGPQGVIAQTLDRLHALV
jgi:DNA-binding transcriptional LysR family regulator